MDAVLKDIFWKQFGAVIDMLENAITMCPEEVWNGESKFWYSSYHTLFYLDYYLDEEPGTFSPPAPFTLSEFDPGAMPDCVYTKDELLDYLDHCRRKCHRVIHALPEGNSEKRWVNSYRNYSFPEILIYNLRHVQHHVGQLNMILRKEINMAPKWVSQTKAVL